MKYTGHLEATWPRWARLPGGEILNARFADAIGPTRQLIHLALSRLSSTWHRVLQVLVATAICIPLEILTEIICYRQVGHPPGGSGGLPARWAPGGLPARWAARWASRQVGCQVGTPPGGPGEPSARLRQVDAPPGGARLGSSCAFVWALPVSVAPGDVVGDTRAVEERLRGSKEGGGAKVKYDESRVLYTCLCL